MPTVIFVRLPYKEPPGELNVRTQHAEVVPGR